MGVEQQPPAADQQGPAGRSVAAYSALQRRKHFSDSDRRGRGPCRGAGAGPLCVRSGTSWPQGTARWTLDSGLPQVLPHVRSVLVATLSYCLLTCVPLLVVTLVMSRLA